MSCIDIKDLKIESIPCELFNHNGQITGINSDLKVTHLPSGMYAIGCSGAHGLSVKKCLERIIELLEAFSLSRFIP